MSFFGLPGMQLLAIFGAIAVPLVALYLLKMRRQRIEVPFVKLWERVLAAHQSQTIWRRLRRLFSLLVQLLLATLVILALGDPRSAGIARNRHSVVVLVDCSASMQARDVAPTRMERAKDEARRIVRGLAAKDSAMIVRMDAQPQPVSGWETDGRSLERAIGELAASDTAADWEGALALAEDALLGKVGPTIVVVSDGAGRVPRLGVDGNGKPRELAVDIRYVLVGSSGENVGITAIGVRRYPANKSSYEVLLEIVSHSKKAARRTLTLEADGEVVDVSTLDLTPGEKARRFYPSLSGASSRLVARIEPHDDFVLDDQAYALLPPRKKQRVLVVTAGNLFLEGALLLEESVEIERITPAAYTQARAAAFDAVVFDAFAPAEPPPVKGALYIAPPKESSPFRVRGQIARPVLSEVTSTHPLMRWISLADVNISQSAVFGLERGDVALASSLHQPIFVAGTRGRTKVIGLGFDLRKSDLPMRVAFPVLLVSALDWFSGEEAQVLSAYRTGRAWRVASPLSSPRGDITLEDPSGERSHGPVADDGFATFFGRRSGFYRVIGSPEGAKGAAPPEAESALAANLADPMESDISPHPLLVGEKAAPSPDLGGSGPGTRMWVWLVGAALALALIEWISYQRRFTV